MCGGGALSVLALLCLSLIRVCWDFIRAYFQATKKKNIYLKAVK